MHSRSRIITLAAILLFSPMAFSAGRTPPAELNQAQLLIFYKDHLQGVTKGSRIDYGFSSATKDADSYSDKIEVTVTDVVAEGKRNMEFNFLSGPHHIDFSPAKAYTGNPVLIHFLERDISQMAQYTGGSSGYLRNRIRDSFKQPKQVHAVKIDFQGKQLDGTEVVVTPFVSDPNADNLKLYVNKRYEFIFSDQIPGGIYKIHTAVTDDSGESVLIDEEMKFQQLTHTI